MIPAVVRRITVSLIVLACALGGMTGAALAASAPPPKAVSLDGAGWRYAPDKHDLGLRAGWAAKPARTTWKPVGLPHVFDPHPDASTFKGLVGWYRVALHAPTSAPGFTWAVHFEQIRRVAQVYLDGHEIAEHRDPYGPFTVALPALSDGRPHELVVRVDNRKGTEPREGWWNWGGITRPAQLVALGGLVSHDPGFLPRRTCDDLGQNCTWNVLVDTVVENRSAQTVRPTLNARLTDPDGAPAGRASATARPLAPGETARVRFAIPVTGDAQLWGPGHPDLYTVALDTVGAGGAVQQRDSTHIGLRTVAVRNGLLELNGEPIELRGASIQEDVDGHGPALADADVDGIVHQLKAVGANVTRAHYALDERLQSKLDEAGILVWTQAPIYHRDELLKTAAQRDAAISTVRATVLATRNHPSTLTHSVANELSVVPDTVPGTAAFLRDARAATLDLDPTLPTAVDTLSYPGFPRQQAYAAFQLLGINSYFGWYPGKPNHSTANVRDLIPYVKNMRAMYPQAGLVLTEFGAESTMTGPASEKETYAFQQVYTRDTLDMVQRSPTLSGAIYWTLQEFAVKPHWDGGAQRIGVPRDSIHNKGLITYDGRPKPAWNILHNDIEATPLERSEKDVAYALGRRAPDDDRGRVGHGLAIAIIAAVALLVMLDIWAFMGWRAASVADEREARERALRARRTLAGDPDAEPARLRVAA